MFYNSKYKSASILIKIIINGNTIIKNYLFGGFDHVVQCGESVYRLESERGNKYLVMPCFYDSRKDNSQAVITDEMPEE